MSDEEPPKDMVKIMGDVSIIYSRSYYGKSTELGCSRLPSSVTSEATHLMLANNLSATQENLKSN